MIPKLFFSFYICFSASVIFANITSLKTQNNLDIILFHEPKVPLVTIVLVSKAGAMTETKDINGLTHLWEHMFFKGNAKLPNQEAFTRRIRQLGIVFNGDTSSEMVRYFFTLPAEFLSEGLEFMSDAIISPLLEQNELERERKVVLDEYDRAASKPNFDFYNLIRQLMYGSEEFRRNALGQRPLIEKATKEQLLRIKDEVFVPDNSAILISGAFDPKKVPPLIDRYFGRWKKPENWHPVSIPEVDARKFQSSEFVMTRPLVQNAQVFLTYRGPTTRGQKIDTYTADILTTILSSRSGEFYKQIVDSGVALDASLSYHTQGRSGELTLYALAEPAKILEVRSRLKSEILLWQSPKTFQKYFSAQKLKDAQRKIKVQYELELNKPSETIKNLAFWWAIAGLDYYEGYLSGIAKVSLKNISDFLKKYFADQTYFSSALLSPEDAKKFQIQDNSKEFSAVKDSSLKTIKE